MTKCRNLIYCSVWLLMCLKFISGSQPSTKLSPRIVKTKYGQLRGIIIDFHPTNSAYSEFKEQNQFYSPPNATLSKETAKPISKFMNDNSHSSTNNLNSIQIEAFLGVAYAQPPLGDRRFLPPVSPSHWRGIKLADQFGAVCMQKLPKELQKSPNSPGSEYNVFRNNQTDTNEQLNDEQTSFHHLASFLRSNQSEDCLHLNIYAPNFNNKDKMMKKDKLPVLVYVHGPSYNWGSGNPYDGSILAWYGELIVITLNYRLGALGFLPTESDGNVRGNYGLLDLIASLHWIQDNIAQFGGDQSNITLLGHNRGAALVHLLMLSQMSKNLFHRAVLMSGSALSPWAISTQSHYYAKQLADKLGCSGSSSNSISPTDNLAGKDKSNQRLNSATSIDCMRTRSADAINNVDLETAEPLRSSFGPIVDGLLVPIDPSNLVNTSQNNLGTALQSNLFSLAFGHRAQANQSPNFNSLHQVNKPLLFGVTRVETPPFAFNKAEQQKGISSRRKGEMLRTLVSNIVNYYQEAVSLTLANEYTDWTSGSEQNFIDSLIDILGDSLVVAPLTNSVNLHLKLTGQKGKQITNLYSYVFVYQPEMSSLQSARLGCVHGEELQLIFGAPIARHQFDIQLRPFQTNYSRTEVNLSKQILNYWANFAKYSNPNGKEEIKNLQNSNINSLNLSNTNLPDSTWPIYDQQRRYFMLGLKSKPRDHYHAHRLSLWLQLIPKLQLQGRFEMEQLKRTIKEESNAFHQQIQNSNTNQNSNSPTDQHSEPSKSFLSQWLDNLIERLISRILSTLHFNNEPSSLSSTFEYHFLTTVAQQLTNSNLLNANMLSQNASSKARSSTPYNLINKPHGLSTNLFNANDYSTALSLIIAIGLILLLFNVIVFLVVFMYKRRIANKVKKDDHKQTADDLNKANNQQHKKARKKQSIDLTANNLDSRATMSYLPMAGNLANSITNSISNAYSANQTTGSSAIYAPSVQTQHTYYYNNVASNDLNCLPTNVTNVNNTGQTGTLNNALTNTLNRRGELDFSDYCCSSTDEHLCIYNTTDRTVNNSLIKVQTNSLMNSNNLNPNNLSVNSEMNRCSANSENSNDQHSTVNCLSRNSQLNGLSSCQCDNCTTIHTLNSNSPLTNQLLNNGLVTGQATLLNANLVNLSDLCDSNQCNLAVIHEYEERL